MPVNWALEAELLAPVGWRLAGPEPAHELEERILLGQGAPAANLHPDLGSPWEPPTANPVHLCPFLSSYPHAHRPPQLPLQLRCGLGPS
jgi:hypothetical protein